MPARNKRQHLRVRDVLGHEWKTPNCYDNDFDLMGDFSAVYALVTFDDNYIFKIAYIGMSSRLSKRFWSHHAIDMIREADVPYFQTWFKRVPRDELRDVERELIRKFDPPLNIIGKVVSL